MQDEKIRCAVCGTTLCVTILGEIDHHSAKGIREEIDRALFYHRPHRLTLSLSEVGFMDSSGLGLILGRYTRMCELGGDMVILDPTPQIEKILHLAGLEKKIPVEKQRERATNEKNDRQPDKSAAKGRTSR